MGYSIEMCLDPVMRIASPIPVTTMIVVPSVMFVVVFTMVLMPVPVAGLGWKTANN